MNGDTDLAATIPTGIASFDFEVVFQTQYARIARVIAQVVGDRARAEELSAEVFYRLWCADAQKIRNVNGWLHKTAVRAALDELRKHSRREKYERIFGMLRPLVSQESSNTAGEEQQRVRATLAALRKRHAELLMLRNDDFSYEEIAAALDLKPAFIGTLLSRAQQAFRKEYIKRYGKR